MACTDDQTFKKNQLTESTSLYGGTDISFCIPSFAWFRRPPTVEVYPIFVHISVQKIYFKQKNYLFKNGRQNW